jgi:hypothetical protein
LEAWKMKMTKKQVVETASEEWFPKQNMERNDTDMRYILKVLQVDVIVGEGGWPWGEAIYICVCVCVCVYVCMYKYSCK